MPTTIPGTQNEGASTPYNLNADDWIPLLEMFSDQHVVLHGAAGEDAMNVGDILAWVRHADELKRETQMLRRALLRGEHCLRMLVYHRAARDLDETLVEMQSALTPKLEPK